MRHALLLALLLATPLAAQLGMPVADYLAIQTKAIAATGANYDTFHGVARDASGRTFASARRATAAGPHKLFRFTSGGNFTAAYDQPAATAASPGGILDLAYDANANVIHGGCEYAAAGRRLFAFDAGTFAFAPAKDVTVPAAVPGAAARGLAYDPFGDGRNGSFFVVDGSSPISEFGRTDNVLRTLANPHPNATALALDPTYRVLWVFGPGGTARPNQGVVGIGIDLFTGLANGQVVLGDPAVPGATATGAEFATYFHDHTVDRLVLLAQGASDTVYELEGRLRHGTGCGGTIGVRGDAAFAGNAGWSVTLSGSNAGAAVLLLSAQEAVLPVGAPVFAANCTLLVATQPVLVALGPVTVSGGAAALTLPIPAGLQGAPLFLQWAEGPSPLALPLRLSDGGRVWIVP